MKQLNRQTAGVGQPYPERILQFGGGNFLRAFTDWMVDVYNDQTGAELGIVLATPIAMDNYTNWQKQDGLYHVLSKGIQNGEVVDDHHLVKSISRIIHLYPEWENFLQTAENPDLKIIISNTTEAGIRFSAEDKFEDAPPAEFPAKLTRWLYHRYQYFDGAVEAGCLLLPVELILDNGTNLRKCILQYAELWGLEAGFADWVKTANTFCNTLVDRIVPGVSPQDRPAEWEKLGYEDTVITQGEPFHLWVIEGPASVKDAFPLHKAGLNVIFTDDQSPYRTRKVRILNGAHTSMVPVAYLYGLEAVKETVEHELLGKYVHQAIYDEIIPTLDLPKEELTQYAADVVERFRNPFIHHLLISISLNSVSKYKSRVLPSLLTYQERRGELPEALVLALAALIHFYRGEFNGKEIPLKDDAWALEFLAKAWEACDGSAAGFAQMAGQVLAWEAAWGQDLSAVPGLTDLLAHYLVLIQEEGMEAAIKHAIA
ncbi:MAG: tagaturonate reductase [Lewinella sp.]|nr:tagaturonate reductase [Lewinella sp.]